MASEEENTGPKLGGPRPPSSSGPKAPSSGGPSLGGSTPPSGGPSLGGPSLGGPSLGGTIDTEPKQPELSPSKEPKKPKKAGKAKVNPHEIIRKWGVLTRGIQRSLQIMMSKEFKTMVRVTSLNKLFSDLIVFFFEGQIAYLSEMIEHIKAGDDYLSQNLMEEDLDKRASTQVFESLTSIVKDEIKEFETDKPKFIDHLEKSLKKHRDARLEPRAAFWVIFSTGLQLQNIHSKAKHEFEIVMDVMLRYKPVQKRVLSVFLHFCYFLIREIPPYHIDNCRVNLASGPTGTGYNLAPWIKYRYGTNSQNYIEYSRYLDYFARNFGKISGTAPQLHRDGYTNWLERTLKELETHLRKSTFFVEKARGNSLEGMLIGLRDELEEELKEKEYDDEGKLLNQPIGGEGALKFLDWLFETAFNRYKTTNISSHGKVRLSLDMFDFIKTTINWENEYGEQIAHDWLELDDEDEEDGEK